MRMFVALVLGVAGAALASTSWVPAEYPATAEEALALYRQALSALDPVYIPSDMGVLRAADHVGRVIEVRGEIAGRVSVNAADPRSRRTMLRLRLASGKAIYATSASEVKGLDDKEAVRAILDVPSGTPDQQAGFRLRAIIRESDVPPQAPTPKAAQQSGAKEGFEPGAALPPEFRNARVKVPALERVSTVTGGRPRDGIEGTWDLVGEYVPRIEQRQLDVWTPWVRKYNPSLTKEQAEWIVAWVIYYSAVNGVDHRLMFAMIRCESDFNPWCVSPAGAVGLTQLMPCNLVDFRVSNKWNVQENIRAGIEHFREMLDMWRGRNAYEQFALAAASYNAGPNRVKRAGGIPDIPETKNYVRRLGQLFYDLCKQGYP